MPLFRSLRLASVLAKTHSRQIKAKSATGALFSREYFKTRRVSPLRRGNEAARELLCEENTTLDGGKQQQQQQGRSTTICFRLTKVTYATRASGIFKVPVYKPNFRTANGIIRGVYKKQCKIRLYFIYLFIFCKIVLRAIIIVCVY